MEKIFRNVSRIIADKDFDALSKITITQPEKFNWARDVFEAIHVKETPDATALLWTDGNIVHQYSYLQICQQSNQLLNFLRNKGVKRQEVIFTQMGLQTINWLANMACIKGGFCLIPSATILSVHDIVYRFGKILPKVVIADMENAIKIDEAEILSGKAVDIKIMAEGTRQGWFSLEDIDLESKEALASDTASTDPLFLFFTSGTTGMPKVVTHTHISYPFAHLTTTSWIGLKKGDIHYNISQPGWGKFTWSSFFAPWNVGATIFSYAASGRFNAKDNLALIEKHKITTFCAPPTVLRLLILENLKEFHFCLRECVAAGEPLNPEVIEIWKNGTGILLRDGYGQTESTCMVANLPGSALKYGSMGKPTFLYDVVIADEEGNTLPANEEGTICVKTDTDKPCVIFSEYFGDPDKKKEVFKHGLYYTGDKAYQDSDGYIWFVGRDDDVIKSSDYRVGPFEVESVLLEHEMVQESAVVGSPHPVKGFEVKAFIVLNKEYTASKLLAEELFAFCRKNIAPYKMPRLIEFVAELPKTISGKIRRVELRATEAVSKAKGLKKDLEFIYVK